MRYTIKHEVPGRIRFYLGGQVPEWDSVVFEETFSALECVTKCTAYPKAGSIAVCFRPGVDGTYHDTRAAVVSKMDALTYQEIQEWEVTDPLALAPRPRHLVAAIANMVFWRYARKWFLPMPIRAAWALISAIPFWIAGFKSLAAKHLDVPVQDAVAIAMGFVQKDPAASADVMFMLHLSDTLENYTQQRSEGSLVGSLLGLSDTALLVEGDTEREVSVNDLVEGDVIVAHFGNEIAVDGTVIEGEAAVNQASLTGESLAVMRVVGDTVYAGTVVEQGQIKIRVDGDPRESKVRAIIKMVEETDSLRSSEQRHIEELANTLVPWNFLLAIVVALVTRDLAKTSAALMVDYSCALRLTGSIAVMAAQRESASRGFVVKGSRYFDHMAEADTIVFDKTGTLTKAVPAVEDVVPYGDYTRDDVLRLAACLEEHFPHPVARAVVNKAFEEHLEHRERHAAVEYVVAHGIASSLDGKRVVIGSEHFVVEDEKVEVPDHAMEEVHAHAEGMSPLFLAVDSKLVGVLYINDPLKPDAADVINQLRQEGFKRIIMLTGDSYRSAARIAREAGIDEFRSDMLPEDKHRIVRELQADGYKVAMVGDGVNDSPALSAAHVSIAMKTGSSVARDAADIALISDDLSALVALRRLSRILDKRMKHGYATAIAINTALLALGISGVITPQMSSLLHNSTTVAISAASTRRYLPKGRSKDDEPMKEPAPAVPIAALPETAISPDVRTTTPTTQTQTDQ